MNFFNDQLNKINLLWLVCDEYPILLDSLEKIAQRLNYKQYNTIEAEIVYNERDYVNSSYRNYEEDNTVFCNVNVEL